jgi:hypothetical protein
MFPFISEEQVLASYYACKDKQFSNIRHSLLCLLNAIFAFATYISAMPGEAITKCATEADIYYHRTLAARASGTRGSNDVEQGDKKRTFCFPITSRIADLRQYNLCFFWACTARVLSVPKKHVLYMAWQCKLHSN